MDRQPTREFGATAKSLSRNPLGIIALFIVLVYSLAFLVIVIGQRLTTAEILPVIYFLVLFPIVVLGVFTYLVAFRAGQLFAPGDFKSEETYLELQKIGLSAAVSLTAAKSKIDTKPLVVDDVVRIVEQALDRYQGETENTTVLWVDDNPSNNIYERKAFEAVGIQFVLSENTDQALEILRRKEFGAVISDMGRREGPREGYALLDAMRENGNETPLFFYASSNTAENKRETYEHGGQGCTDDSQELFEMVTKSIFESHWNLRAAERRRSRVAVSTHDRSDFTRSERRSSYDAC